MWRWRRSRTRHVFLLSFSSLLIALLFSHSSNALSTSSTSYHNATALLSSLLDEYDIRLRPGFGGDALLLTMDIIIASFDAISEVDMDYTVTLYLHQYWRDERLSWINDPTRIDDMTLSGDFSSRIWVPDTFLANDKHSFLHDVTERNKMLRITRDGRIAYGMRFTSTLACSMDLRNFPLDAQNCTVEIESYGYTTEEVLMKWNQPHAVHGVESAEVPQFKILGYQTDDSIVTTATGSYQRLSLVFQLKRSVGYFIFQTYLPCVLIVMLSWVSFWINHEATSARVALGITTVLTMTTISTGVRQSLPRISYVKSIDIYLVMCFVFVFAALLEYAAVNYNYWGRRARNSCRSTTEEGGWPGAALNGEMQREAQEGVDWRVPQSFQQLSQEISDREAREREMEGPSRESRRPASPLPSLCAHAMTDVGAPAIDEVPDYPRYTAHPGPMHVRQRPSSIPKSRPAMLNKAAVLKPAVLKSSMHKAVKKARSVIPSLRVRDVNVIDKYSRIVFPLCFIIFNIFYWGYYTIMQQW
ncbi:unnamed protein product, partial [Mesorhabditis belari]|uniref:Gamma-aminobutyric acid receptor subunit beta n=1 Tax=Mesorhabditis belari TaxID=2138241 RepID=A0AAF3EAP0_9BILA